ncbi:activator 1 36 [Cyclospora cayetanensis]|uniref:Activator 1 36 n=1 Tax=Cyclospora cayetanensis TaxID=88456 RepID=A0A1D3CUB6_9EIME|nr:activator 1 36 [Cyclospora cayetanensis]
MDENRNPQDHAERPSATIPEDMDLPWVQLRQKPFLAMRSFEPPRKRQHVAIQNTDTPYPPWTARDRTRSLGLIIIQRYLDKGQLPHLLFHGPPGTGKTSTILAVARQLYGTQQASHVLELNASDDRGIGSVRELVKTFAETTSASFSMSGPSRLPKLKLIILDEADQMTSAAQNALRRIMETYARNVRFCLICNLVNKITPAIQSRCTRRKAEEAAKLENMTVTEDGYEALIQIGLGADGLECLLFAAASGDMRRLLNCMQAASMAHPGEPLDGELIHRVLGLPQPSEVKALMQILLERDLKTCSAEFHGLVTRRGYSIRDWTEALHNELRAMKLPVPVAITLVTRLADIEERLALGSGEFVQDFAAILALDKYYDGVETCAGSPKIRGGRSMRDLARRSSPQRAVQTGSSYPEARSTQQRNALAQNRRAMVTSYPSFAEGPPDRVSIPLLHQHADP